MEVLSLYDKTGISLRPWADAGFVCFAYDIQNPSPCREEGGILYMRADLHDPDVIKQLVKRHKGCVRFMSAYPVCTDLCLGGAVHWEKKRRADPLFQETAAAHVIACEAFAEAVKCPKWYIENPRGALNKMWRRADMEMHPYEYGGHLPRYDSHPNYPEYIPPRDAYKKRTCIWHSDSFRVPEKRIVIPVSVVCNSKVKGTKEYSPAFAKLGGGGGQRTKDIRSATPRGWARAVYLSNR